MAVAILSAQRDSTAIGGGVETSCTIAHHLRMPFQWHIKQLGSILRGRGVHQCLVVTTNCALARSACALAKTSLENVGIRFTCFEVDDAQWPTVSTVRNAVADSRELAAQAVVGIGADGVLDTAKATAALSRLQHDSPAQFIAGVGHDAAPPSMRLPMVAVLTRPSLAGSSGRCLLWHDNQLSPLQIQGDSSHWGIGPGLPPTVEIVDPQHALGVPSVAKGTALSREQQSLLAGATALAAIVDMRLSTSHTIKAEMLRDSTHAALSSIRVVFSDPARCEVDALSAVRVAGMATTDTDATAYAQAPVIHALACAAGGALPPCPDGIFPYANLCAAFVPAVLRAVETGGSADEKAAMASLANSVMTSERAERSARSLARYLDERYSDFDIPSAHELLNEAFGVRVDPLQSDSVDGREWRSLLLGDDQCITGERGSVDHTAKLVALSVFNSPQVRGNGSRALPYWFDSIDKVLTVVTDALHERCSTHARTCK